jgi:L-ribulose-5-phosphate 3-epimerase
MKKFKIGVISDLLRLGQRDGIKKAAEIGADGVQVWMTTGAAMGKADRDEFKAFCRAAGVEISAFCGDLGHYRDAAANKERVPQFMKILDLARDIGTKVVTTHIGAVPDEKNNPIYKIMLSAMREMAEHGAKIGVTAAVETGPEKATVLKKFLDDVGSKGLGVNLDPANLVMVAGDDPAQAVLTLGKYIVHTHAKDGIQLWSCDPEQAYHGTPPPEKGPAWKEVPLGEGSVNWDKYLAALEKVGFTGYLTIEREVGDNPAADIAKAIAFLKKKIR